MNVGYALFERPELLMLKDFLEEFISLAEPILNLEIDELNRIDKACENVLINRLIGEEENIFSKMSESEIKSYFLYQKQSVLVTIPNKYPLSRKNIDKITKLVKKRKEEVNKLRLVFKHSPVMMIEIYINYKEALKQLEIIKANIEANTKKNK